MAGSGRRRAGSEAAPPRDTLLPRRHSDPPSATEGPLSGEAVRVTFGKGRERGNAPGEVGLRIPRSPQRTLPELPTCIFAG